MGGGEGEGVPGRTEKYCGVPCIDFAALGRNNFPPGRVLGFDTRMPGLFESISSKAVPSWERS
jgi:hypothetical protein